jgi:hypothetical protein
MELKKTLGKTLPEGRVLVILVKSPQERPLEKSRQGQGIT